jgi:tRNA(Ile)-lysidine synthase
MARALDTYARWAQEMRKGRFFRAGERVGVAASGGADSTLLLEFMTQFGHEAGLAVAAVHFNHHLRGAESDRDEGFVAERAQALGIPLFRDEADVAALAHRQHRNLEATARELRYRFFFSLIRHGRLDKVATAHTANDQAETVLLRLLRGAGARGLSGIYPVLDGVIVRPFLNLTRREVEDALAQRGLAFRTDASNQDTRLVRNRVRAHLLPLLEREFNPNIVRELKDLADRARHDEAFLEEAARERALPWRVREGREERIPARTLADFPPALARRVLRQMTASAGGRLPRLTHAHLRQLERFAAEAQSGRRLLLPGGLEACREFDWLVIRPAASEAQPGREGYAYPVRVPGAVVVSEAKARFVFARIPAPTRGEKLYNSCRTVYLNSVFASRNDLLLRSWRPGDRFHPAGSQHPHKLKELLQRRKIPLAQRAQWPLLVSGNEIVWVRGIAVAARAVLEPSATEALRIVEEPLDGGA